MTYFLVTLNCKKTELLPKESYKVQQTGEPIHMKANFFLLVRSLFYLITHLLCWFFSSIKYLPSKTITSTGNMSPDIEFPGNGISHDCTGDISCHLRDSALQLIQHGLHGFNLHQWLILQRQERKGFTVLSIQPFLENSDRIMWRIYKLPPDRKGSHLVY